jgi:hypothetical protein
MRKRLLVPIFLAILIMTVGAFVFSPFLVSTGFSWWLRWQAHRQGLKIEIGKTNARFLGPVSIDTLRVTTISNPAVRVELTARKAILDLNLAGFLTATRSRAIHLLSAETVRAEIRRDFASTTTPSQLDWRILQRMLPSTFNLRELNLRIENGSTVILLKNASISGNEIESGRFTAADFTIASPWFRQTFTNLRGSTRWQENRLMVGGINLTRGLDLQSLTIDFSHLAKQRAELQGDLDVFGGKIRASVENEWHAKASSWSIAGVASGISLGQTAEATGFTDQLGGSVRACNFTFRGDPRDLMNGTASVWAEVSGLSWRNRAADVIMLGAAFYDRRIQLQQLYVKQRNNQLTMSGEGSLPSKSADWLRPDFRGDISGSIKDLGQFASFFGAAPGDFAGTLAIDGTMNFRDRKIGGHLSAAGESLSFFKTHIDKFTAKVNLKATELEIEQLEINRKKDFVRAQGKIDLTHEHDYSGTLSAATKNLPEYLSVFRGPSATESKPIAGETQITIASGTWNVHAALSLAGSSPLSLDARFPLKIGQDWNTFLNSPLEVTIDFPELLLANTPKFFHPEIFTEGLLSGKLSLSQTLQHPKLDGEIQLLNAKLQDAPLGLTQAGARVNFSGDRATLDSFNVATKDVDLSGHGEIEFKDVNDLSLKIWSETPIYDLNASVPSCVNQVEIRQTGLTLAPSITELDFRGGLFASGWKIGLIEHAIVSPAPMFGQLPRELHFCSEKETGGTVFAVGAQSRTSSPVVHPRKRSKRR